MSAPPPEPTPARDAAEEASRRWRVPEDSGCGCGVGLLLIGTGGFLFAERVGWVSPNLHWFLPLLLVSIGCHFVLYELLSLLERWSGK